MEKTYTNADDLKKHCFPLGEILPLEKNQVNPQPPEDDEENQKRWKIFHDECKEKGGKYPDID